MHLVRTQFSFSNEYIAYDILYESDSLSYDEISKLSHVNRDAIKKCKKTIEKSLHL